MSSGNKNYFRHSFYAIDDPKIQIAISKMGFVAYAYYFSLLELLARQCTNEIKNPIEIHKQSIKNVWRKQTQSCDKVITKLQESGLFVATFREHSVLFDIPNLSKYIGSYSQKQPLLKEKKVKENKINEKKNIKKKKVDGKFEIENFAELVSKIGNDKLNEWFARFKSSEFIETELVDSLEWSKVNMKARTFDGWNLFFLNWLKRAALQKKPTPSYQDALDLKALEKNKHGGGA